MEIQNHEIINSVIIFLLLFDWMTNDLVVSALAVIAICILPIQFIWIDCTTRELEDLLQLYTQYRKYKVYIK